MRLGLDLYGTITKDPTTFKLLARSLLYAGDEVHIITAVAPENVRRAEKDIRHSRVPYTALHIVTFDNYLLVPQLKAQKAKQLGLDMMIDDREDTCKFMELHKILALRV